MTAPSRAMFIGGLALGVAAGCLIGSAVTIPFAYASAKKKEAPVRKEWGLRPIVAYHQDLSGKEALTFERITQRAYPEHTLDDGMVSPNDAPKLIGRRVIVPVAAIAPVRWVDLAPREAESCFSAP